MIINYFLWMCVGILVGIIGYLIEANKKKSLFANIVAAFLGAYISGFIIEFVIYPVPDGEVNLPAVVVAALVAFLFVKLEDDVFH